MHSRYRPGATLGPAAPACCTTNQRSNHAEAESENCMDDAEAGMENAQGNLQIGGVSVQFSLGHDTGSVAVAAV